jgi:TRAP-type C4-dicarboxylate transport system substrate-binding protein
MGLSGCTHRQAAVLSTSLALAAATAGCTGSHLDKAGGSRGVKPPLVLKLATHDDDYAYGSFAAAVAKLSGGSMRIKIATNWRATGDPTEIDYERGIVTDVRSGKVPLGIVGVRVWDTLGVPAFRALVAPFLIESLDLEARAIEGEHGRRALPSVSRRGVVGIALLPGLMRRPFGITRALVKPSDYDGAKIGIRPGRAAAATIAALGGVGRSFLAGDVSGLDGAELDLLVISTDVLDSPSRPLTGNVVLWPKAQTIVMNRAAFRRLTAEQRAILRRAGRAALEPELKRDARDERYLRSLLCNSETPVVMASAADRAALRRAVASVYRSLERDPDTKSWIAQIRRMRKTAATGTDVVRCQ